MTSSPQLLASFSNSPESRNVGLGTHSFCSDPEIRLVLMAVPWITAITAGHSALGSALMHDNLWLVHKSGNSKMILRSSMIPLIAREITCTRDGIGGAVPSFFHQLWDGGRIGVPAMPLSGVHWADKCTVRVEGLKETKQKRPSIVHSADNRIIAHKYCDCSRGFVFIRLFFWCQSRLLPAKLHMTSVT